MKFSGKFTGLLLAAIVMLLAVAGSQSAQAVPYTVCNNSAVPVTVTLIGSCGLNRFIVPPANVVINPGTCFTWNAPNPPCSIISVRVNGVAYATPAAVPFCYPVAAPPPNFVCFTGGAPQVNIF